MGQLKDNNVAAFDTIMKNAHFGQWNWKCRAKEEMYNDENKVKATVLEVSKVNYATECAYLVGEIKKFL